MQHRTTYVDGARLRSNGHFCVGCFSQDVFPCALSHSSSLCKRCALRTGILGLKSWIRAKSESIGVPLLEVDSFSKRYDISFFPSLYGQQNFTKFQPWFDTRNDAPAVYKLQEKVFKLKTSTTTQLQLEKLDRVALDNLREALPHYTKLTDIAVSGTPLSNQDAIVYIVLYWLVVCVPVL